jgi:membrane-associated phospholipid phosphatase
MKVRAQRMLARVESKPAQALVLGSAVLVTAIALWLFSRVADWVTDDAAIVKLDQSIIQFTEAHNTEVGETFFSAVSMLGSVGLFVVVLVAAVVLLRRRLRTQAFAVVLAGASGMLWNYLLKLLFARDRPNTADEFIHHASWSFPSGHAMNSIVCYGFLAMLALEHVRSRAGRSLVVAGTAGIVFLIAFSRIYLAVHYVSDVLAGLLAGFVWLMSCIAIYTVQQHRAKQGAR